MAAKKIEMVVREGKPVAVILELRAYQELLERAEDVEDLKMLARLRRKKLSFRKLGDFLKEFQPDA